MCLCVNASDAVTESVEPLTANDKDFYAGQEMAKQRAPVIILHSRYEDRRRSQAAASTEAHTVSHLSSVGLISTFNQ